MLRMDASKFHYEEADVVVGRRRVRRPILRHQDYTQAELLHHHFHLAVLPHYVSVNYRRLLSLQRRGRARREADYGTDYFADNGCHSYDHYRSNAEIIQRHSSTRQVTQKYFNKHKNTDRK